MSLALSNPEPNDPLALVRARMARSLRIAVPPPLLTVSEWADRHRMLTSEASSEPGRWDTARAPYQRELLNAVLDPDVEQVVLMTASQVGKTEVINNVLGYYVDCDPCPVLVVQPTVDLAEAWSKDRLAPMLATTPVLAAKVSDAKSRDSENTILHKTFQGGHISCVGANAPSALAMRPVRLVLCDEVDRFPASAGTEGDPVRLALRRSDTFWNRKALLVSTPTVKGVSRIESAWLASDMRRYYVPCAACGHMQVLRWDRLMWDKDEAGHPRRESVTYRCEACEHAHREVDKALMLERGTWVAEAPGRRVRGYHLNSLCSPWRRWDEIAEEFATIGKNVEALKVFVNTVLGEVWEEQGDAVSVASLEARRERYEGEVPDGVGFLVAAVDVQGDRLEVAVVGFGDGEESWLIAFSQIHGDPSSAAPWNDLRAFLDVPFDCASGQKLRVELTVVDSGGQYTEQVYRWSKAYLASGRRVFPVKGGSTSGLPLVGRASSHNKYAVPLFVLCVDSGKEAVLARLRVPAPGPGYVHLPEWVDEEFLAQMTAEKALRKYVKGRGAVRVWVKTRERNEAFDLMVYALAALYIAGAHVVRSLGERAAKLSVRVTPSSDGETPLEPGAPSPRAPRPRPSGWVNSWRG